MSTQDTGGDGSVAGQHSAGTPSVRRKLARDLFGTALAEALFFWLIAHLHHPSVMWDLATPWALSPLACALPGLVFGGRLRLVAAARGMVIGAVLLGMGMGVLVLFDQMSD
ncbi:hypothetical protein [Kutzneria chonburiensis]|uniref:Uncharacterized protein n=1 Tax=Kutzneria chonburiensis TaxID=1483604 RepID=A0ABV6MUU5_9PSEU|nr:hypothetical protein [Kutzneria chonburiensis]